MTDFFTQDSGFFSQNALFDDEDANGQPSVRFAPEPVDIADDLRVRTRDERRGAVRRCDGCGGTEFESIDGILVCKTCNRQSQFVETQQDEDYVEIVTGGNMRIMGVKKQDADLVDPLFRIAKRTTFLKALKVLVNDHVNAMTLPAEDGGRICAPAELTDVVNRIWDSWMKQQFVFKFFICDPNA